MTQSVTFSGVAYLLQADSSHPRKQVHATLRCKVRSSNLWPRRMADYPLEGKVKDISDRKPGMHDRPQDMPRTTMRPRFMTKTMLAADKEGKGTTAKELLRTRRSEIGNWPGVP